MAYDNGQQYPPYDPYAGYGAYPPGGPPVPAGPITLADPFYGAGIGTAIKRFWLKYATFSGRASRSEFWWWFLVSYLVGLVLGFGTLALHFATAGLSLASLTSLSASGGATALAIPGELWQLATLVGWAALAVRRLHDVDRSGWWYLLMVPIFAYSVYRFIDPPTIATFSPGTLPTASTLLVPFLGLVPYLFAIPLLVFFLTGPKPGGQRFDRRR